MKQQNGENSKQSLQCQMLSNPFPVTVKRLKCHFEWKNICELGETQMTKRRVIEPLNTIDDDTDGHKQDSCAPQNHLTWKE